MAKVNRAVKVKKVKGNPPLHVLNQIHREQLVARSKKAAEDKIIVKLVSAEELEKSREEDKE